MKNKIVNKIIFLATMFLGATGIVFAESEEYSLSFETNGGSNVYTISNIPSETTIILDSYNPTKEDNTFAGWYSDTDLTNKITSIKIVEDTTIYAKWYSNETYSLTYELDGGTLAIDNPTTYQESTESFTLNNPTKEGYDFVEWLDEEDNSLGEIVTIEQGTTGNKTFKATYKLSDYTTTFTNTDIENEIHHFNDNLDLTLYTPTKEGYVFAGWYLEETFTTKITKVTIKGDTTIYAKWLKKVTITTNYLDEKNNSIKQSKVEEKIEEDKYTTKPEIINGYKLNETKQPTNASGTVSNKNITVNYYYNKINKVTIKDNNDTIKVMGEVLSNTIIDLNKIKVTKEGYTFEGFYSDKELTTKITRILVTKDQTIYTKWTKKYILIINYLDENNKILKNKDIVEYKEGEKISINPSTISGYEIDAEKLNAINNQIMLANKSVNVVYTKVYTLSFNSNGGTLIKSVSSIRKGTTINLNNYISRRNGYDFKGWTINNNYIKNITINSDVTVSASWSPTIYNITYNLDGGVLSKGNVSTYTVETETFTLSNPVKKGHTFIGWSNGDKTELGLVVMVEKGSIGNKTYNASYRINKYEIRFENTNISNRTFTYGTEIDLRTKEYTPEKDGYKFAGWFLDSSYNNQIDKIKLEENTVIYAKWELNDKVINPDTSDAMILYLIILFAASLAGLLFIIKKYMKEA